MPTTRDLKALKSTRRNDHADSRVARVTDLDLLIGRRRNHPYLRQRNFKSLSLQILGVLAGDSPISRRAYGHNVDRFAAGKLANQLVGYCGVERQAGRIVGDWWVLSLWILMPNGQPPSNPDQCD